MTRFLSLSLLSRRNFFLNSNSTFFTSARVTYTALCAHFRARNTGHRFDRRIATRFASIERSEASIAIDSAATRNTYDACPGRRRIIVSSCEEPLATRFSISFSLFLSFLLSFSSRTFTCSFVALRGDGSGNTSTIRSFN